MESTAQEQDFDDIYQRPEITFVLEKFDKLSIKRRRTFDKCEFGDIEGHKPKRVYRASSDRSMDDNRPLEDLNHNFLRRLDAARIVNLDKVRAYAKFKDFKKDSC